MPLEQLLEGMSPREAASNASEDSLNLMVAQSTLEDIEKCYDDVVAAECQLSAKGKGQPSKMKFKTLYGDLPRAVSTIRVKLEELIPTIGNLISGEEKVTEAFKACLDDYAKLLARFKEGSLSSYIDDLQVSITFFCKSNQ